MEEEEPRGVPGQWISEVSQVEHPSIENIEKMLRKYNQVMLFFYINGKNSNLHCTCGITSKRVTSGGDLLRKLA